MYYQTNIFAIDVNVAMCCNIMQIKIMRSKDRINSQGIGRSMGYGFVEFTTHEAALSVVRAVSNNPSVFGPHKVTS